MLGGDILHLTVEIAPLLFRHHLLSLSAEVTMIPALIIGAFIATLQDSRSSLSCRLRLTRV